LTSLRKRSAPMRSMIWGFAVLVMLWGLFAIPGVAGQGARPATWRAATAEELRSVIPLRAPVIAERIETEMRTASGVVDSQGHTIAGVVLITAGYSANGKYSDYFVTQVPLKIGNHALPSGAYLIGWTRSTEELLVTISEASTGKALIEVPAVRNPSIHRVESFRIWPPFAHPMIQLGRFTIDYSLP